VGARGKGGGGGERFSVAASRRRPFLGLVWGEGGRISLGNSRIRRLRYRELASLGDWGGGEWGLRFGGVFSSPENSRVAAVVTQRGRRGTLQFARSRQIPKAQIIMGDRAILQKKGCSEVGNG